MRKAVSSHLSLEDAPGPDDEPYLWLQAHLPSVYIDRNLPTPAAFFVTAGFLAILTPHFTTDLHQLKPSKVHSGQPRPPLYALNLPTHRPGQMRNYKTTLFCARVDSAKETKNQSLT